LFCKKGYFCKKDYTLFALTDGYVKFETFGKGKKRVSIYAERKEA